MALASASARAAMPAPIRASCRLGPAEQELELLAPEEVAVDGVGDVGPHAAVQVLGGVHRALAALGGLPLGHLDGVGGVTTRYRRARWRSTG